MHRAYTKIIRYGNFIELYEYEKAPEIMVRRSGRTREVDVDNKNLGTDGEDSLSEGQLGRRQDNARRVALVFRRLVSCNLSGPCPPLFITFTYKEEVTDITIGYQDYRSFMQALRYKYGETFKYICVPEFQKSGRVHFHTLFWGLPSELFIQERETRTIAMIWGKGFIDMKETDGNDKLSYYLAKYMAKAFKDSRLKNQKAYVASKNILRPIIDSGFFPAWPLLDDYLVDENNPEFDRSYDTKWLGNCRHRLFITAQ